KIMNKIIFNLICAGLVLVMLSCKDEDRIRIPDNLTGANMRIIVDPDHRQINYQSVTTDYFAFDAYSENTDLDKVEFSASYHGESKVIATFGQSDFTSGKVHVELRATDFANLFNNPGFTDGTSGGNFVIKPKVTLTDGRVYPSYVHITATDSILNLATSIIGSSGAGGAFTIQVTTAITCPPLDISGTYNVVSAVGRSTDGCCPEETTVSGDKVTVTVLDATTFAVSDITGGLYFEWYDVYGITGPNDTPGKLAYNCQEVLITDTPEPFGTQMQGSGTYDPASGRIVYSWSNGYGDQGTVTLVRS
ncbi:MAG TPA: hypothetical protein VJ508_15675, partial [Saprospiraceae bacterium]|nr:hypothetical protein [Saprospiraceae bacterium]